MATKKDDDGRKPSMTRQIRPPKIDIQLKLLANYYEAIKTRPQPSFETSSERLVDQWQAIESSDPSIAASPTFFLRGTTHDGKPPLAQLFEYIAAGFYPPPELLLTLLSVWEDYLNARGDMRLEDAFLGQPVPNAGNYAGRAAKKTGDLGIALRLGELTNQGMTKGQAAQAIADEFGLSEESIKKIKSIIPDGNTRQEK